MGSPRQPLGASSNVSISAHDAALSGATRAFVKALPREQALKIIQKEENQAVQKIKPPLPKSTKPSVSHHAPNVSSSRGRRDVSQGHDAAPQMLIVPKRPQTVTHDSTSSIAASLAAARATPSVHSRSSPPLDNASIRSASQASVRAAESVYSPLPPKRSSHSPPLKRASPDKLDQTSIAPTTSLVQMFEQNDTPLRIKSPKPGRKPRKLRNQVLQPIETRLTNVTNDGDSSSDDSFTSARDHLSPDKVVKPELPPARRSVKRPESNLKPQLEPTIHVQPPSRNVSTSRPASRSRSVSQPNRLPVVHSPPSSRSVSQAKLLPVSHSPPSTSHTKPIPKPLTHPEHQSITAAYHQLYPRRMTPLKSGDSLANAIVASSLASSRAPSPTKLDPSMSHRRTSHGSFFSRTPSPPKKVMRHTMRKNSSSSSEDSEDPYGKHKKKRHFKKHPNKHNEGDRKRWRDAITQRERKRYEGVWAANKGICVEFTQKEGRFLVKHPDSSEAERIQSYVNDQVSDLVVRDIWSRSRLPAHELEQVWDLVDTQGIGRLQREEFVVGLWLVDQRLKGRKLPVKVTDSVWNSVRLLSGIKLRQV